MNIKVALDARAFLQAAERAPEETAWQMRQALREACHAVKRTAQTEHKFKSHTGNLEQSVVYRTNAKKMSGTIYLDSRIAPYGVYVHEPTGIYKPHGDFYDIYPKNKRFLRWVKDNHVFFSKHVRHPGSDKDQFLYEAAEKNREKINEIFARRMENALRAAGLS